MTHLAARPASAPPASAPPASAPPSHPLPPSRVAADGRARPSTAPPDRPPVLPAPTAASIATTPASPPSPSYWDVHPCYSFDAPDVTLAPPARAAAWARPDGRGAGTPTTLTPAFPPVYGPRMIGPAACLLPADALVAGGLVLAALAVRVVSRARGAAHAPPPLPPRAARSAAASEAAAVALRARFAGALDGGNGVGGLGGEDEEEEACQPQPGDAARRREWRRFARAVRLHLVDNDAWVT